MQHQVVLEELGVLGGLDVGVALGGQQLVDAAVDLHPVDEVRDLVAPVADRLRRRLLHHVPEVDVVGDQRDAARGDVRLRGEQQVLVVDADRELQALLQQERAPVALVRGEGVVDQQVRVLGDRLQRAGARVDPGVPLGGLAPPVVQVHAHAHARDEVGSGPFGRGDHVAAGVAFQHVVAVQEHDVGAGGLLDAVVAGRAAAAAVLRQPEGADPARVRRLQFLGDRVGPVLAAVVHDHDFDPVQGLVQNRLDGCRQTLCVVIDDDDHGDVRHVHLDPFVPFRPRTPSGDPRPSKLPCVTPDSGRPPPPCILLRKRCVAGPVADNHPFGPSRKCS